MKIYYRWFLILLFLPFSYASQSIPVYAVNDVQASQYNERKAPSNSPIYIIIYIGDGMGAEHRKAAGWVSQGMDGSLVMDTLPAQGLSQTASASSEITDSAAGGTAIATGTRTNNGIIALSPEGETLKTILEYAQEQGLAVGLVTTVQISHATPASFGSHVPSRTMMNEIALQLFENEINVLMGGGEDEFLPSGTAGCYPEDGERTDGRNLILEASAAGYTTLCTGAALDSLDTENTNKLIGLFSDEGMLRPFSPTLVNMTTKAIEILDNNPQGFFLMVEGGQIDWASHSNDAENAIQDTIDFDAAVNVGVNFMSDKENGVLIVTADHETGGMSVHLSSNSTPEEDGPFYAKEGTPFYIRWATSGHTAADVPVSAMGKHGSLINDTIKNTDIFWAATWPLFPKNYLPMLTR